MRKLCAAGAAIVMCLALGGLPVLAQEASAVPTPTATPAPTPSVVVTRDLAYESSNPVLTPGKLDVYAPVKAGSWPLVVMFHGGGNNKGDLSEHARKVADLGFVVFSATWGAGMQGRVPTHDEGLAIHSQAACAVEFARAHAPEYGGDPATMVVFGHSAGANTGALVAFARPEPTAGCLGGPTLGPIDALVTWEGDWVLQTTFMGWDEVLAADPRIILPHPMDIPRRARRPHGRDARVGEPALGVRPRPPAA